MALVTAGAYLRKTNLTFQQYLDAYEQRWQVDPRRPPQLQDDRGRTLYTTWKLTYNRLKDDDAEAAEMLTLLAYFDNQEIWYELFRAGLSHHSPERLRSFLAEQANFESVIITLVEYCLIEVQHTTQSYSMHNCVHDWLLGELNSEIDPQLYWYAFDCTAASIDKEDQNLLGHIKYARLSRHGLRLTHQRFRMCFGSDGSLLGRLGKVARIVKMLIENHQHLAAEWICERALAGCEDALGPEHSWTLDMVYNLGVVYSDRGKLVKAEQMYKRALATAEKIFGPHHKRTFAIVNGIGIVPSSR